MVTWRWGHMMGTHGRGARAVVDDPQLVADVRALVRRELHPLLVLGVGDLLGRPLALVRRVVDLLRAPLALEVRVVDQRRLPLAIVLVVPVLGLGRVRVRDLRRDVVVALRLLGLGVIDLGLVDPVL